MAGFIDFNLASILPEFSFLLIELLRCKQANLQSMKSQSHHHQCTMLHHCETANSSKFFLGLGM